MKLSQDENKLVLINGMFNMANTLSQVFVNVYLYEYTGSLVVMSIYTIIRIGLFPFAFTFGGKVSSKLPFSVTITTGLLFIIGSLAFILTQQDLLSTFTFAAYIVAVLTGIGEGLYWFSINTCNQLVPSIDSRGQYLANIGVLNNITALVAPLLASLLITISGSDNAGYINIFRLVIVIYIVIVVISVGLKVKASGNSFRILDCLSLHHPSWRFAMASVFFYGVRDGLTLTLSGLLIYDATASSGTLYSNLLAFFSVAAIIAFYVLGKKMTMRNMFKIFCWGAFLMITSTLVLVWFNNIAAAIYFGVTNAIATAIYNNPFVIMMMSIINGFPKSNHVGRVIAKETYQSLGRCFGMALIVACYFLFPTGRTYLLVSVTLCSLCPLVVVWLVKRYDAKYQLFANGDKQ